MRVLVIDAYPADHADGAIVDHTVATLERQGNTVEVLALSTPEFAGFMTAAERAAYETDEPLISPETKASAASIQQADALLFCYPTVLFGVSPRLKSWLERVMVLGVAFVFDDQQRIRPGLRNIVRIGVVTTSPHSRAATLRARDLGYRTFMRTLRLNCHPRCRRTFVRLPAGSSSATKAARVDRRLRSWR